MATWQPSSPLFSQVDPQTMKGHSPFHQFMPSIHQTDLVCIELVEQKKLFAVSMYDDTMMTMESFHSLGEQSISSMHFHF